MLYNTDNPETKGRVRTRFFPILYSLLVIGVIALASPVSAAMHTLNPGDPIEQNITDANAGDTLILNPGTYNQHNIHVTKDIVLRANTSNGGTAANTIIDGQMINGIFNITGVYSLAVDNLTLRNGITTWGGGINLGNGRTLTVNSSSFLNCSATNGGGAIISGDGSILTVTSSTFSNCSATQNGGAILLYPDSSSTITGSTFSNCSATGNGGAILFVGPLSSTITGSTFSNCSATGRGGAINAQGGTLLTVTSSTFSRCSAAGGSGGGGAIYGSSSTLTVNSSTFSRCSATGGSGDAGAIFLQFATAGITSSTFYNCTGSAAGAIFSFASDTTVNFSRIYGMPSMAVTNNSGTMEARYNWWGSNGNPSSHVQYATYSPWLILNITATPASISGSQTSTIRVNLTRNYPLITDTAGGGIFVPDGIPVAFVRTGGTGTLSPQAGNFSRGANTTTFTPAGAGTSTITAMVDDQTVSTDIVVTGSSGTASMVGVFRNATHTFYLKNGTKTTSVNWGQVTDTPVTGDWNGDGLWDVGVFRNSTHTFILKNGTKTTSQNWGTSTDMPVTGDWNGDGLWDVGVFRNASHTFYLKNGTKTTSQNWGQSTDTPVTGDWNGDGLWDVGVFRKASHTFYLKNGTKTTSQNWG
ncbi:MAG: hypothetical protein LUO98_00455, partial [Methanoregula sp.]|nr:hypothetical protein [Methanoregula sp.]